ncbi:MAG: hypothetical protein K2X99_06825 [Gemmatimonadaceae bacterium]|nr:hypothetical protein [Gemmatimonadaceae bacterium]
MSAPALAGRRLALIRIAMISGVAVFLFLVWALRRRGDMAPASPELWTAMRALLLISGIAVLGVAVFVRSRLASWSRDARGTAAILTWAVGEFAGLAGGMYLLTTGDQRGLLHAILAMGVAFIAAPVPRD